MITLFTGMPGAGKTAAMVDLLASLTGDRPIFVHYDPSKKKRPNQVLLHESLKLDHQPCLAENWHLEVPDGAILVIDEVQDVWRPRGSTSRVPDAVQALETHRHGAVDIYMTTQAPRLVDSNVRGLVNRHVHIRDTGWLGRHWYEWPECNESLAWKTCPVKKSYKLPKRAFDLYQSATEHNKSIRMVPAALYWAISFVVFALVAGVMAYRTFSKPIETPAAAAAPSLPGNVVANESPPDQTAVYDYAAFIPRVSSKPESAPAYDALRTVAAMPLVSGGACMGQKCKCYTQQGTDAGLSFRECRQWIDSRPFNPYLDPSASGTVLAGIQSPATSSPVAVGENVADHVGSVIGIGQSTVQRSTLPAQSAPI